jgi:hypothetical protein
MAVKGEAGRIDPLLNRRPPSPGSSPAKRMAKGTSGKPPSSAWRDLVGGSTLGTSPGKPGLRQDDTNAR